MLFNYSFIKLNIIMENEEKQMTGEESLRIISEMINKTKVNISQGSFHLLFWGWLIFTCSLSDYLITRLTSLTHPYYVWFLVIPGIFVSLIYGITTGRRAKVLTYAERIYMWTWIGFLGAFIALFFIQSKNLEQVGKYILLLAGFATFVSGSIIRFRPLIFGGICFWIIGAALSFAGPSIAPLGMPLAVITGYLIPGYMLKNKIRHDKV
jgi:hypothetical protein